MRNNGFFNTNIDFLQKNSGNFNENAQKTVHFAESNNLFFANMYHSQFDSY